MGDELRAGDVIADRYELRAPLGRGGTSTAWRALDRTTSAEIALKRLEVARAADWKYVELFAREGKLLAQIEHPAIPRYLGAFTVESPSGTSFFLAQSLIAGISLAEQVEERGTFGEGEARDIARQVLGILADLHAMKPPILHRDLKPGNIIVDSSKRAHLVDFGAARRRGEDTGSTVVGTYGFMAPEQLRGSAVPASDLYGLGATLAYLLYRVTPAELPQKRLRVQLPSKPELSPSFAAFLRRLLEPAPEDRFSSAATALMGIDARPPSSARVAVLSGLLVALLAGGGFLVSYTSKRSRPSIDTAKAPLAELPARLELPRYSELYDKQAIAAHMSGVFDVSPSADGKQLATASVDRTAKVWWTQTWKSTTSVGHDGPVGGARFANDSLLVTGGDHTVRTWELPSGAPKLKVDAGTVQVSAIDVRSEVVAAASFDGNVRLISLKDGTLVRTLAHSPNAGRVLHVAYSPDGSQVASGGDDRTVRIWRVADGTVVRSITGFGASLSHLAFSPDGAMLAATGDDNLVRVYALANGALLTTLKDATDHTWGVAWDPSGNYLVVGGKDARLRAYAVPTFALQHHNEDNGRGTIAIAFDTTGRMFTGQGDGTLHIRALPRGKSHAFPIAKPPIPRPLPEGPKELVLARRAADLVDSYDGHRATLDGAEKLAQESLTLHPKYTPALTQLARIEMRRGMRFVRDYDPARLAAARKWIDEGVASDAKSFEAREILAWILVRQKDLEGARAAIGAAEAIAPKNPRAALVRAEIASRESAWDEAERLLREVLEGGLADAMTLAGAESHLVEVFERLGDYDAVDEGHRRNIARSPKSAWTRGNYALFLNHRGEFGRAIEVASEAIALSDYPIAHHYLATAHVGAAIEALWDRRDAELAKSHAAIALKERPSADGHYVMAAVHWMRGARGRDPAALAEARAALVTALKLEPNHAWAGPALADLDK